MILCWVSAYAFDAAKYYTIHRNGEQTSYIFASGEIMNTGELNAQNATFIWQLIPTGNADCYYVKNVGTDTYVQSTTPLNESVRLGAEPVEIMISTGAGTTGTGTNYFFASTDQGTIDYSQDATLGLNKGASSVVAFYIKTGRGNSYWEIDEVDYNTTAPSEPSEEDDDVCLAIAAYRIPCGTFSAKTKLTAIDLTGEGVLSEVHYKGNATGRYTLLAQERAVLMRSGKVTLQAALTGADVEGLVVTVWADFDGDGQFETSATPALADTFQVEFVVPELTQPYQGRFRIRLDQSGGTSPNADFYGAMYDVPFTLSDKQEQLVLSVTSSNAERGAVAIEGTTETQQLLDRGTVVTVTATPQEGYYFHGWRKDRNIVSYDAQYTTTMTENKVLVALFATTEPEYVVDDGTYPTNFPKATATTRTDRKLTGVSLTPEGADKQTVTVNSGRAYNDLTKKEENALRCQPGQTLKAEFVYSGSWMHGYVYIDENNDKQFSYNEGQDSQEGTEVKSYSFYSGAASDENSGYNSAGQAFSGSARNTLNCPSFTAPSTPGTYRIRFKVDWNSIDPGGRVAADGTCTGSNGILANGGYIVDASLVVEEATGINQVEVSTPQSVYTIAGRRVALQQLDRLLPGVYVINGKKVVVKRR